MSIDDTLLSLIRQHNVTGITKADLRAAAKHNALAVSTSIARLLDTSKIVARYSATAQDAVYHINYYS